MTTEQKTLKDGCTATLERNVATTDIKTKQTRTFDKLTITERISKTEMYYFISPNREVFRHGLAVDLTGLPSGAVLSKGKETLTQLSPEETEDVLKLYDQFK